MKSHPQPITGLGYRIAPGWVYTWLAIFAAIMILSVFAPDSDWGTIVKLGGIGVCFLFVIRTFPRDYFFLLAMLSTCIADVILANNNTAPAGIIVFLAAQLLHLCRLDGERLRIPIIIYASFCAVILTLDYIFNFTPVLFVASSLYALTLITNIIVCVRWCFREPKSLRAKVALAGFGLFACCDFCTSLSYLSLTGVLAPFVYAPANFFVWLFYYPSQVLIANTGKYAIMKQKEG